MITLLVLEYLSEETSEGEEEHSKNDTKSSDGLIELLHIIEHVEFPSPVEHLLTNFILHNNLWNSAIVFLGIAGII